MSTSSSSLASLKTWFGRRIAERMLRNGSLGAALTLGRRNIYILPTRYGFMFLLSGTLIFVAAINYAVSLAFGLAFMMASVFVISIFHSFANLNRLGLRQLPSPPVFCGEHARFRLLVTRYPNRRHEALDLRFPVGPVSHLDLTKLDQEAIQVFTPTERRGRFEAPLLTVSSTYPLGLCRAWSVVDLGLECIVYPKPMAAKLNQAGKGSSGRGNTAITRDGSEDFYGLRDYVPGDSIHQIAWKAAARGQGLLVKQFIDYADDRVWLEWDSFPGVEAEQRLSKMCFCALQLSASTSAYGLRLPGVEIAPGKGAVHRDRVLEALALFPAYQRASHGN